MIRLDRWLHLQRRFVGSLSSTPPDPADEVWALGWLAPAEQARWWRLDVRDRRHAVAVAHRALAQLGREPTRAEVAGFLLHDCGKVASGLGTAGRVLATLRGSGRPGSRTATYHRHEAIGAAWLAADGSDPVTVALVARSTEAPADALAALQAADDA